MGGGNDLSREAIGLLYVTVVCESYFLQCSTYFKAFTVQAVWINPQHIHTALTYFMAFSVSLSRCCVLV